MTCQAVGQGQTLGKLEGGLSGAPGWAFASRSCRESQYHLQEIILVAQMLPKKRGLARVCSPYHSTTEKVYNISVWKCFHGPFLYIRDQFTAHRDFLQHTRDKLLQLGKAVREDTCTNVLGAPLSLWQLIGYLSSTELVRLT